MPVSSVTLARDWAAVSFLYVSYGACLYHVSDSVCIWHVSVVGKQYWELHLTLTCVEVNPNRKELSLSFSDCAGFPQAVPLIGHLLTISFDLNTFRYIRLGVYYFSVLAKQNKNAALAGSGNFACEHGSSTPQPIRPSCCPRFSRLSNLWSRLCDETSVQSRFLLRTARADLSVWQILAPPPPILFFVYSLTDAVSSVSFPPLQTPRLGIFSIPHDLAADLFYSFNIGSFNSPQSVAPCLRVSSSRVFTNWCRVPWCRLWVFRLL